MFKYGALVLALFVFIAAVFAVRFWWVGQPSVESTPMPIHLAIEERWGIRVTQVGVTADGGLIDFRYIVLDPDKALNMLQDVKNLPVLVAEDSGDIVNSMALMAARHNLQLGRTYFLLYRNTKGAIKHGSKVSVVFSAPTVSSGQALRLEHVTAQ